MQLASSQHEGGHRQSHPYASGQIMQISFRCAAICCALCHPPSPLSKENLMLQGISTYELEIDNSKTKAHEKSNKR